MEGEFSFARSNKIFNNLLVYNKQNQVYFSDSSINFNVTLITIQEHGKQIVCFFS